MTPKDDAEISQTLGDAEQQAIQKLSAALQGYDTVTLDIFDLINEALSLPPEMTWSQITQARKVATALLIRLGNDLRCASLLALRGYPAQAASLGASIYEVAYTIAFIGADESRAQDWINHKDDIHPFRSAKKLTEEFARALPESPHKATHFKCQYEGIYRKLCKAKHANPLFEKPSAYEITPTGVKFTNGPRWSPVDIRTARFALEQAAELSFFGLLNFIDKHLPIETRNTLLERREAIQTHLRELNKKRTLNELLDVTLNST